MFLITGLAGGGTTASGSMEGVDSSLGIRGSVPVVVEVVVTREVVATAVTTGPTVPLLGFNSGLLSAIY